jgi:[pyruvate, water dikinase]-phosphate phosphotransferase / [pyruvate, water dikinase] kinase
MHTRTVFFVSDGTGITAEMLGHSLLTQFEGIEFTQVVVPFVDTAEKAQECLARIEEVKARSQARPIVFCTLIDESVRSMLRRADALVLDFFEGFINPLEVEFRTRSSHAVGRSHSVAHNKEYQDRIEAVNYALAHDDGLGSRELARADVILVGVSRSGKTPTCLYMAMQFGIKAANYPLTPDDFERAELPGAVAPLVGKLFGLTITPERLSEIRHERRPDSRYARLENCRYEVEEAEKLMRRYGIEWLNSTTRSIEEIATKVLQAVKLERRAY